MDIEDAESSVSTDQENELELEKGMAKLKRLGIMHDIAIIIASYVCTR